MSIRAFLSALLLAAFPLLSIAQEQGQLDANPALFSVMAAINAAGYDAGLDSAASHPLRAAVRKELAAKQIPSLPELKRFFEAHRKPDPTAELSQYVSFALSVTGPPDFAYKFREQEIPPDVVPLAGFEQLMARFHREANIDQLWQKAQPAFEEVIGKYHEPATRALLEVNAYMRNTTSGFLGRRFQILVELLAPPNQIQMRTYADEYFIVVTPSAEPQTEDVRHAYLHYLLDPLASKDAELLMEKRGLIDYAQGAPYLDEPYKLDFLLLATESMIKAVEARLSAKAPEARQALVNKALGEGYVLTPYFAEALPVYEKQEQSMRFYFPEIVKEIDLKKEARRLANVQFSEARPVRRAKEVPAARPPEPSAPQKSLDEAENLYAKKDYEGAKQVFLRVLRETDQKPLHAMAYFGMARIAALQRDPELAERLFQKTLESSPDDQTKGWALIYLGRLADIADDREQATRYYEAAVKVEGASPAARKAAQEGLQEAFKRQGTPKKQ